MNTIAWLSTHMGFELSIGCVLLLLASMRAAGLFKSITALQPKRNGNHSMLPSGVRRRMVLKTALLALGIISLSVALLRPAWGICEEKVVQHGRDIIIALDISRSMLAQDVKPSRLEVAKAKIKALLRSLDSERVGLILFAGSALMQCPLTTDFNAFDLFLESIDANCVSESTTALDSALRTALDAFKRSGTQKHKLLVVLTDGEDFSDNLNEIGKQAAQQEMRLFAWAIGTQQGSPIPLCDEYGNTSGHVKDKRGSVVISRVNVPLLTSLINTIGGSVIHATKDDSDVHSIVHAVRQFQEEKREDKQINRLCERAYIPALGSFICLLLDWLL